MYSPPQISDAEFKKFSDLILEKFGICLPISKKDMLVARLNSIMKEMKFCSFEEYYNYVTHDDSNKALSDLINKISTNFSFFYRGEKHFHYFSNNAFPELLLRLSMQQSRKDVRM